VRIEQQGAETCELGSNGGFVFVRVPIRSTGGPDDTRVIIRYQLGGFAGREIASTLRAGASSTLSFRIPLELFRERERLTLEVLDGHSSGDILWSNRYHVRFLAGAPGLEAVSD